MLLYHGTNQDMAKNWNFTPDCATEPPTVPRAKLAKSLQLPPALTGRFEGWKIHGHSTLLLVSPEICTSRQVIEVAQYHSEHNQLHPRYECAQASPLAP